LQRRVHNFVFVFEFSIHAFLSSSAAAARHQNVTQTIQQPVFYSVQNAIDNKRKVVESRSKRERILCTEQVSIFIPARLFRGNTVFFSMLPSTRPQTTLSA